jgi:hypothetical protein
MAKNNAIRYVVIAGICCVGTLLLLGFKSLKDNGKIPEVRIVQDGTIEIREKLFIAQTNEIYLNPEDYMGRTIRLEGLFKTEHYAGEEDPYCFVLRYGPGCCGYDGSAGFEVAWAPRIVTGDGPPVNALTPPFPNEDDWVEAVGMLSSYDADGYPYLYLQLTSLTVKQQRGAEFVTQ